MKGIVAGFAPWTTEDDALLARAYTSGGIEAACAALPARTRGAIYHRAQRVKAVRRRRWTAADDAHLRRLWDGETTIPEIAKRLGRSQVTTYWRAQKIGLPLGCPDGWGYLSVEAKRVGFLTCQLRKILRLAGGSVRRALAAPHRKRRGKYPHGLRLHWIVVPGEVDAAVEAWLESEPVAAAARRIGVCGETLSRRLVKVGIKKPTFVKAGQRMKKRHWRVRPEDVEAAMSIKGGRFGHFGPRGKHKRAQEIAA